MSCSRAKGLKSHFTHFFWSPSLSCDRTQKCSPSEGTREITLLFLKTFSFSLTLDGVSNASVLQYFPSEFTALYGLLFFLQVTAQCYTVNSIVCSLKPFSLLFLNTKNIAAAWNDTYNYGLFNDTVHISDYIASLRNDEFERKEKEATVAQFETTWNLSGGTRENHEDSKNNQC